MPNREIRLLFTFGPQAPIELCEVIDKLWLCRDGASDPGLHGHHIGPSPGGRAWEAKVLEITHWPEVRKEWREKRVDIPLGGWTQVRYPSFWQRDVTHEWVLSICFDGDGVLPIMIRQILHDAVTEALAAVVPILLAGNPSAATAALLEPLRTGLLTRGIANASQFSTSFIRRCRHGEWTRV
ncbi:hypothetical protein [Shimia biformata]|uniref:hypothetical protein n=1 Tax=Shimia biformata TaxID=1294299 RepID=UPI00194FB3EA|nr:hypothetical protein [Shimia biformata]